MIAAAAADTISAAISSMRWPRNSQYAITDRIDLRNEKNITIATGT
jgi:hypothetical protein